MFIAILSTLISSIALVGVVISLLLQARQLRASRVEAAHNSQIDMIKFAIENPSLVAEMEGVPNDEALVKDVVRNWYITNLWMSYDIGTVSKVGLQERVAIIFSVDEARKWWERAARGYELSAVSKREKEFFIIVNGECQRLNQLHASSAASGSVS